MRLDEQIPDPEHCWVRFVPRPWPGERDHLWLDLSTNRLGRPAAATTDWRLDAWAAPPDDLVYLPPVQADDEPQRTAFAESLAAAGAPVLMQTIAGLAPARTAARPIVDVLHAVATGELDRLAARIEERATVVWPLIGGYTDDPTRWRAGLARLAEAGIDAVVGIVPELAPVDRRRIVEICGEHGFDELFHGAEPSVRAFATMVEEYGLEPLPPRPVMGASGRLASNRRLAGELAAIGDLWLRLGRSDSQGQGFFRAARWIDRESHDLTQLARDGNLGIVSWLDGRSRAVIEELVATGGSGLLEELRADYLQGD